MINKGLIESEKATPECIAEIARTMAEALTDCRNELAEIRGWKDGYVLNASDALECYKIWSQK